MHHYRFPISSAAALAALLLCIPLHGQTTPPATSSAANADERSPVRLSPFEVTTSQDEGYAPSESLSGTKVRTPVRDLPMNIQVVTADFIDDIGAFDLQEAMAYNASVTVKDNAYEATIRGFTSSWQLRNGFRYYKRTDTSKVARIETISGPAAVLYGITQPGGILNVITKTPNGKNSGRIAETISDQGRQRTSADINVHIADNLDLLLVGAYDHDESSSDFVTNRFHLFSPTLVWKISNNTKLTVDIDWSFYGHPFSSGFLTYNGVPIQSPVSEGGFGVPISRNYEGPDNYYDETTRTLFATLEHSFSDNLTFRVAYNSHFQDSDEKYQGVGTTTAPAGNAEGIPKGTPVVRSYWRHYVLDNTMNSFAADGLWKFETGAIKHQVLFGGSVGVDKFYSTRAWDVVPGTNTYQYHYWSLYDNNPDLNAPELQNFVYQDTLSAGARREENTVASVYVTHQGRFWDDRLITLAGVIYNDIDNYVRAFDGESQRYTGHETSPQIGIVGRPIDWLSVYALYATSLYPQPGGAIGGFGEIFPPVKGKSFEYGFKLDTADHRVSGTVSLYDIRQTNRVIYDDTAPNADNPTADPNQPRGANVPTGETMSKGVDVSVFYHPTREFQLIGSYAYNNTEILSDAKAYLVGRKVTPYFRHRAALWTKYDFARDSALKGLGLGLGATWDGDGLRGYSSSSASGIENTVKSDWNLQARVSYGFMLGRYHAAVAVDGRNLLEHETVAGGKGDVGYYFKTPREFRFSFRLAY